MVCWCSLSSRVRKSFPGLYTGMITSISVNVILPFVKKLTLHHITNLVVLHPKHFFFSWKFFFLCVFFSLHSSSEGPHRRALSGGKFLCFQINLSTNLLLQGADKNALTFERFVRPLTFCSEIDWKQDKIFQTEKCASGRNFALVCITVRKYTNHRGVCR